MNTEQAIQARWLRETFIQPSLVRQLRNFRNEADEVMAEVQDDTVETLQDFPEDRKPALAGEVIDTIIAGMGVLTCLGIDFETAFYKKIGIMYDKYNPQLVQELVASGKTHDEAMAIRKSEWRGAGLYE